MTTHDSLAESAPAEFPREPAGTFGIITDAWNERTLRQAAAMACTVKSHHPAPVVAFVSDRLRDTFRRYSRLFDEVVFVLAAEEGSRKFTNKLLYLLSSPFDRTLWLDNDMLLCAPLGALLTRLTTSSFGMFIYRTRIAAPEAKALAGYQIAVKYGRDHVIDRCGGGHFYFARSVPSINLIHELLHYSTATGLKEYNEEFGTTDKIFSEELALCLVAMKKAISLPLRLEPSEIQLHCYNEPNAADLSFTDGRCRFRRGPPGGEKRMVLQPDLVHFCGNGKQSKIYIDEIDRILSSTLGAGST